MAVALVLVVLSGCSPAGEQPDARAGSKREGPIAFPGETRLVKNEPQPNLFSALPICADADEPVHISDMQFATSESGGATVRFMVDFDGPRPGSWGGGSVKKLSSDYVEADGGEGEVLPCSDPEGSEIAFIVERTGARAAYAQGFEMSYLYRGRTYTASSLHTVGICGSTGDNPEPIADLC
ncbi:MAG: hypothetical protein ACRCYU_19945 [Nocardioides sp.]